MLRHLFGNQRIQDPTETIQIFQRAEQAHKKFKFSRPTDLGYYLPALPNFSIFKKSVFQNMDNTSLTGVNWNHDDRTVPWNYRKLHPRTEHIHTAFRLYLGLTAAHPSSKVLFCTCKIMLHYFPLVKQTTTHTQKPFSRKDALSCVHWTQKPAKTKILFCNSSVVCVAEVKIQYSSVAGREKHVQYIP